MATRSQDWFRQAEADLEHAHVSVREQDFEWSYIQARYPNGFASGAPLDYFTERDARESIDHAQSILDYCRTQIRQP
jgi:HEPN domain-containing protein